MANSFLYRDSDDVLRWHDIPHSPMRIHAKWPFVSLGLSVHPKDALDHREYTKKMGCHTEFKANGGAVMTGPGHRKRVLAAYSMVDRDTYTGRG